MNERHTLRCQACRKVISQDQADRAQRVFDIVGDEPPGGGTHCPTCAKRFADDSDN